MNETIELKPIVELLNYNFSIPNYQRGYRWQPQQAVDLLEDIKAFVDNNPKEDEIYCIQPLVVSKEDTDEDILKKCHNEKSTIDDIRKYINGTWNVVDGQQRLTTIFLILTYIDKNQKKYDIEYKTRDRSADFLKNINEKNENEAKENIDYYHMYKVYEAIKNWFERNKNYEELIKSELLSRINFIWYEVSKEDEIDAFKRLNIGKIPLTDAELIKALFLNRKNYDEKKHKIDNLVNKIANQWDEIEFALQNDEFWLFIHNINYSKPTRIDFILDYICEHDIYEAKKNTNKKRKEFERIIGNDEHKTFRYFYEIFKCKLSEKKDDSIRKLWDKIYKYFQIFKEWYQDFTIFHYIGFFSAIYPKKDSILDSEIFMSAEKKKTDIISEWDNNDKKGFIIYLKSQIVRILKEKEWIRNFDKFDFGANGKDRKRECLEILLLHNIETIIQQNIKIVDEYHLPNFTKFPFHLYKKESWDVEHIRPNSGSAYINNDTQKKMYLSISKEYVSEELKEKIETYIGSDGNENTFEEIMDELTSIDSQLLEDEKNKIWNYTLLDSATNREYGNQIFPVKRMFIVNKENGLKKKYSFDNNNHEISEETVKNEIAFVPPCTKNVFMKFYTKMPKTMTNWSTEDANDYLEDMKKKLEYYLNMIKDQE